MRRVAVFTLAFLLSALGGARPTQAVTISVAPSLTDTGLSALFDIELVVFGLGDGTVPSVGAFDLDVSFNPTILSFVGAVFGDPILGDQLDLFALGSLSGITPGAGLVNVFELSLDAPADLDSKQRDSFTLATLTFEGIGSGLSVIGLSGFGLSDSAGAQIAATLEAGSAQVPEAPAVILVALGIMMAGIMRGRAATDYSRPI